MFVTVNIEKIEISCTRRVVAVGAIAPGCPPKGTLPGVGPPGWAASTRSHKRGGEEVSYATRLVWQQWEPQLSAAGFIALTAQEARANKM